MDSTALETKAAGMQEKAWQIIAETDLIKIWQEIGAVINLVGSLKTGLLINHRDIDFHIYTDPFCLKDSFLAMAKLAENPNIQKISYTNLMAAEDRCLEWHAVYRGKDGEDWQIDLIHLLPDSPYAGYFEKVAARISEVLTAETRLAILQIKESLPAGEKVMGIQIYQAVISGGVRNYADFSNWLKQSKKEDIIHWIP